MFRLLKVRPPHGWPAVWWELAIVTLGVLIALIVQQWADARSWAGKAEDTRAALRQELAEHYAWSVEWRAATPCMLAQIERLQQRVVASGATLEPAPVFRNDSFAFVIRLPSREYTRSVYGAALADGVVQRFEPAFRNELNQHYEQVGIIAAMTQENGEDYRALFGLSRPMPLDAGVRFELLRTLDRLAGRIAFMELLSGHVIHHVEQAGMTPDPAEVRRDLARRGTFLFCREQHLPLRDLREAMRGVSN